MTADIDRVKAAALTALTAPFGAVLIIVVEHSGRGDEDPPQALRIDGRSAPPAMTLIDKEKARDGDCIWHGKADTLVRILETERALESAYVSGRLTISGDMSVMARLTLTPAQPNRREAR